MHPVTAQRGAASNQITISVRPGARRRGLVAAALAVALALPVAGALWTAQPAAAAPVDGMDAKLISVSVNGTPYSPAGAPVSVAADHVFTVEIVMENTGTVTWGSDRSSGRRGNTLLTRDPDYNTTFGAMLIVGRDGREPGTQVTYQSGLRAPSTPGDYTITWQPADWVADDPDYLGLTYPGATFYGDTVTIHVTVTAPTPAPAVPAVPASTVNVSDFEYQGSFALPPVPGAAYEDEKYFLESGIALRTVGGEQRLLALTGTYGQSLYEVAVPPLGKIAGADTSSVPTATLRTYFGGLPQTPGVGNGTIWYDQSAGLFYWETHSSGFLDGANPPPGVPILRAATLASGTLDPVQQWTVPTDPALRAASFAGGVTGIPAAFAAAHTGGRTIGLGFGGLFGPALAAVSAPAAGGDLDYLPVMYSTSDDRTVRDGNYFSSYGNDKQPADPWTGSWIGYAVARAGVFIDLPDKKGYLTFVHQPIGRVSGDDYDGGHNNAWYVYDYATLGAAAAGGSASLAPVPSSYAVVALPGDGTPEQQVVTGSAFDPATRLLYVYSRAGIRGASAPVVHVYKVRESTPTGVSGVPTTATAGTPLTLRASVAGTGHSVTWSVADAGPTGAVVTGSTLTTTGPGTATVRASVTDGGVFAYSQDFTITVNPASYGFKQISRFTVNGVAGVIDEAKHEITVVLPADAPTINGLKPEVEFTGASVTPGSGVATDFSGSWNSSGIVQYTVTARDGTTQTYRVVVGVDEPRFNLSLSGPYTPTGQNAVQAGATGQLFFSVANFGLAAADDLALVLTLPAGITPDDLTVWLSGRPSTYDKATGWWRIPHLDAAAIHGRRLNGGGARLDVLFAVPATAKTGDHFAFTGQLVNVSGRPAAPGQYGTGGVGRTDFLVVEAGKSWPMPTIDTSNWASGAVNHSYDLTLFTYGSGVLTDVAAVHRVPDGFRLVSATPTVGTYDAATGQWTIGTFTPTGDIFASPKLTMVITPDGGPPPTPITLSLQVPRVYGVAPDPPLGTTVYVGLSDPPSLILTAQADVDRASPGDTVVHTLRLGTNTPAGVYGAVVAVTLPAHVSLVSAVSPGGGSFDQATGTWTAAPLGSGITSTLTLTYKVDAGAPEKAEITTAAIAAAIPTLGFNNPASALVTTTVTAGGDPTAKQITRFTVDGVDGVIDQANHTIVTVLPTCADLKSLAPVITYLGASVSPASGVARDFSKTGAPGVLYYDVVAADGSTTTYYTVVSCDAPRLTLGLSQPTPATVVAPGVDVTVTIWVGNWGFGAAEDLVVRLPLPTGIDPATVAVAPRDGTYDRATGLWTVGHLDKGGLDTVSPASLWDSPAGITVSFPVPAGAATGDSYSFTPEVVSVAGQPPTPAMILYPLNSYDYTVVRPGEGWLRPGFNDVGSVPAGTSGYTYRVFMNNVGTADLTDVEGTHQVPAGLSLVSATPSIARASGSVDPGTYDPATGVWTVPVIPGGAVAILTVVIDVPAGFPPGSVPLSVQVTRIGGAAVSPPLTGTDTLEVQAPVNLSLSAGADRPAAAPGETVVHTLTATSANTYAFGLVAHVTLPAHATLVSATAEWGAFDAATGQWTANVNSSVLGGGLSVPTLRLEYRIDARAPDGAAVTTAVEASSPVIAGGSRPAASVTTTVAGPLPSLALSRTSWAAPAGATATDVTVTTNQSAWSAASDQAWLTTKVQGSVLTLTAGANPLATARTATVTVTAGSATATVAVTQAGGSVSVGTSSWVLDTAGGKTTITISSTAGWVVSGLPAWVTATASSGAAGTPLNLTAAPYSGGAWDIRSATVTIGLAGTDPASPVRTQVEVRQHNWPGGDQVILHEGVLVTLVKPGWTVDGVASGFAPGETVHGWMHSLPYDLGTAVANANGVVTFTWVIPGDAPAGAHRLELIGQARTVDVPFTVLGSGTVIEVPSGGTTQPPPGWLAALLLTGAGLTILGMGRWGRSLASRRTR